MTMQDQIDGLWRMMPALDGEELQAVLLGTVNAPGIDDREGILFVTRHRMGASLIGGEGREDAWIACAYEEIKSIGTLHPYIQSAGGRR